MNEISVYHLCLSMCLIPCAFPPPFWQPPGSDGDLPLHSPATCGAHDPAVSACVGNLPWESFSRSAISPSFSFCGYGYPSRFLGMLENFPSQEAYSAFTMVVTGESLKSFFPASLSSHPVGPSSLPSLTFLSCIFRSHAQSSNLQIL